MPNIDKSQEIWAWQVRQPALTALVFLPIAHAILSQDAWGIDRGNVNLRSLRSGFHNGVPDAASVGSAAIGTGILAKNGMSQRKNFPLRISHSLYQELQRMADQELRSVNAQIEFLLLQAIKAKRKQSVRDQEASLPPADHPQSDDAPDRSA